MRPGSDPLSQSIMGEISVQRENSMDVVKTDQLGVFLLKVVDLSGFFSKDLLIIA